MVELKVTVVLETTLNLQDPVFKPDDPEALPSNASIEQQVLEHLTTQVTKFKSESGNDLTLQVDVKVTSTKRPVPGPVDSTTAMVCNAPPQFAGLDDGVLALFQEGDS